MIDLYSWSTPNGRKVSILLEELGVAYEVHPVNIGANEQRAPDFVDVSPNNKIPAIVDRRADVPVAVFESGAILSYLCETTPGGETLWPTSPAARATVNQWLMWQMSGIGPIMGRAYRFVVGRPTDPENRRWVADEFLDEVTRLLGVMDAQLGRTGSFLANDHYSIADIACFPWVDGVWSLFCRERPGLAALSNVQRWRDVVGNRPAVQRGMAIPAST